MWTSPEMRPSRRGRPRHYTRGPSPCPFTTATRTDQGATLRQRIDRAIASVCAGATEGLPDPGRASGAGDLRSADPAGREARAKYRAKYIEEKRLTRRWVCAQVNPSQASARPGRTSLTIPRQVPRDRGERPLSRLQCQDEGFAQRGPLVGHPRLVVRSRVQHVHHPWYGDVVAMRDEETEVGRRVFLVPVHLDHPPGFFSRPLSASASAGDSSCGGR